MEVTQTVGSVSVGFLISVYCFGPLSSGACLRFGLKHPCTAGELHPVSLETSSSPQRCVLCFCYMEWVRAGCYPDGQPARQVLGCVSLCVSSEIRWNTSRICHMFLVNTAPHGGCGAHALGQHRPQA